MTTILLGVGAVWSGRLKQKYDTRKQDKLEYANRFEELKAENAKRQSFIDNYYQNPSPQRADLDESKTSQRTWSTPVGEVMARPPSYEDATNTQHTRSYASSRTNSTISGR